MSTVSVTNNASINHALIIDDDGDYRKLMAIKLSRSFPGITINEIDPLQDPMPDQNFNWENIDFIILDYNLGIDYTGLDWFKKFNPEDLPATMLLTAKGSEELAVKAIKIGMDDYIVKEHFDNERLTESIIECVSRKNHEKQKRVTLSRQRVVFNKHNFIHRLRLITNEKDTNNHLIMINPVAYQQIGQERGLYYQDSYIRYVADCIYEELSEENIAFNIFIYREEYIAVLIEAASCQKYLDRIYSRLTDEHFPIGVKKYKCSINVGVISPRNLEASELNKSDFELLSIAMVLCNTARSDAEKEIYDYGDVDLGSIVPTTGPASQGLHTFDLEKAIEDGRVSANYQPWVYILSDDEANLKDIYDVRIEFIDTRGNIITQNILVKLLDGAFARRIVDKWVFRNTVNKLMEFPERDDKENNVKLAVKITLSSLADPEFINWLKELLAEVEMPKGRLLIEIDATQLAREPQHFKALINEIGAKYDVKWILSGIIEIDKYYQARELQLFDFVKLNISKLTYGTPRGPLKELVQKIRNDGAKVVAVNVADAEMLALASEFNVDYMHGYLIGKPNTDVISDSDGDLYCVI